MSTQEELSKEIASAVAGVSHDATFTDDDGKGTLDQAQAVYQYLPDQNVMVMVNHDKQDVEIWYDPVKTDTEWFKDTFKPQIENIAKRYLYGTTVRSYAGDIQPKSMAHRTADYDLKESRNTSRTSYHPLGHTKVILRHSKPVTEEKPGARSRNIGSVFIENNGERFRYPHNHLLGARVMALHVDKGGKPWDTIGEKIIEISRRRKDVMELLRWSKRLDGTQQVDEIRNKGKSEVIMLKRMMERAARTGDLSGITEYELPSKNPVAETMVGEAVSELTSKLDTLLG
jgi:hypothetical protein